MTRNGSIRVIYEEDKMTSDMIREGGRGIEGVHGEDKGPPIQEEKGSIQKGGPDNPGGKEGARAEVVLGR